MSDSNKPLTRSQIDVTRDLDADTSDARELDFVVDEDFQLPTEIGDYTITRLIGQGGMGRVYEAEHRRMARTVAIKVLPPERMRDRKSVDRFYAEVRATARLMHPNIVTAFDAGNKGDVHYLAMEYVEGQTLTRVVLDSGPFPLTRAVNAIRQTSIGLQHAHTSGIVHRDVKPSNLMITADGTVKILDLGLSTIGSESVNRRKKGRLVGTIEYMPPEQIEDPFHPDRRNDIYSLGATFFYLLTGRTLYEGDILAQARAHRESPIPDLFELRPDVDVRLDQILRRMLAKRVEDRYSSCTEVLEDLDEWSATAISVDWSGGERSNVAQSDDPTAGVEPTTATTRASVLGFDLGMFYLASATAEAGQPIVVGETAGKGQSLLHCAVATQGDTTVFGAEAIEMRTKQPHRLAHCVQLYLGTNKLDRNIGDRQIPPEVALGMVMRHGATNAWDQKGRPAVVAVTVPGCYDQTRRRSVYQAAQVAGFKSIRLIDRPLAAAQSQLTEQYGALPSPKPSDVCHWLVVCVTGSALEVSIVRHVGGRFHTLATFGDWSLGVLAWQQRVVDIAATDCLRRLGRDPRKGLKDAVSLQLACEKAIRQLSIKPEAVLDFQLKGRDATVTLKRRTFGAACSDLLSHLRGMIDKTIESAGVDLEEIGHCLTVGTLTRMPQIADVIRTQLQRPVEIVPIDRPALAAGAASAVMGELPGQSNASPVPHSCTNCDLGLLVYDGKKKRPRTVPVIPRSTALPARTSRRLWQTKKGRSNSITIIESAGWQGDAWRSLGNVQLPATDGDTPLEAIMEVDGNGLLKVRIRNPNTGEVQRVPPLPTPVIENDQVPQWCDWIENAMQ